MGAIFVKPLYQTNNAYDIVGNDHVAHVQKRIDENGESDMLEIVLPQPNQLQLDYDTPELPVWFERALAIAAQAFCPRLRDSISYTVTSSKSGNRHVTVDLPCEIDDLTRVAWQAALGSDPMRESLSLMSIRRGIANPSLLLEVKGAKPVAHGFVAPKRPEVEGRMFRRENYGNCSDGADPDESGNRECQRD